VSVAYARIEAHYHSIPDLLDVSCRRFCNLVLEWLMQNCSEEAWNADYKDTFFGDPAKHQMIAASRQRLAPAQDGQQGSLNIQRKEAKPVGDMSQFLGRAGSAGKADPNKAAQREISERRAAMTIGPDADGNLSVDVDDR